MVKRKIILTPLQLLKKQRTEKKEVGIYYNQTKSPIRNTIQSTYGSVGRNLAQRGYSSKEIRAGRQITQRNEINRQRALKSANKGFNAVLGF